MAWCIAISPSGTWRRVESVEERILLKLRRACLVEALGVEAEEAFYLGGGGGDGKENIISGSSAESTMEAVEKKWWQ